MKLPNDDISADSFRKYDLKDEHPSPQFLIRESHAREQLALDLALSRHIFSPRPFAKSACLDDDKVENMCRSAEALSLNNEPPRVQFGFLQPNAKQDDGDPIKSLPERLTLPLGVRLLLKEWEIGADPNRYEHDDPYSESLVEDRSTRPGASGTTSTARPTPPMALASPRMIASKMPQPREVVSGKATPFKSLSQGSPLRHESTSVDPRADVGAGPQVAVASTQTLSGPHGGRMSANKKTVKKRLGGF